MKITFIAFIILFISAFAGSSHAEANIDAQANNPLANLTAFNIQDYGIAKLSDTSKTGNQVWFRYAKPIKIGSGTWLARLSLPINTFPVSSQGNRETAIGDLNFFAAYLFNTGNKNISFGIGPQLTAPTTTNKKLDSKKWSAGFANVLFNANSSLFQFGYLLTWQASFAGSSDAENVSLGAFQPFAFYQLGQGYYIRSAPIWTYSFINSNHNVPLGIGAGKVIKSESVVYNLFIEPQGSVAHKGRLQPLWQIFIGFNMQFY